MFFSLSFNTLVRNENNYACNNNNNNKIQEETKNNGALVLMEPIVPNKGVKDYITIHLCCELHQREFSFNYQETQMKFARAFTIHWPWTLVNQHCHDPREQESDHIFLS